MKSSLEMKKLEPQMVECKSLRGVAVISVYAAMQFVGLMCEQMFMQVCVLAASRIFILFLLNTCDTAQYRVCLLILCHRCFAAAALRVLLATRYKLRMDSFSVY